MTTLTKTSKIGKITKMAIAIGFGFVICGTAMGPAFAGGHGEERHHEERHKDHGRDRYRDRNVYVEPAPSYYYEPPPSYYYAPPPNYYYAPEPGYYPPAYSAPPPPSEGVNLFFGIHH